MSSLMCTKGDDNTCSDYAKTLSVDLSTVCCAMVKSGDTETHVCMTKDAVKVAEDAAKQAGTGQVYCDKAATLMGAVSSALLAGALMSTF